MVKLIVIADDFTGALDTAVQFASEGANTKVVVDSNYQLSQINEDVEVLVINAESRHLSSDEAYLVVHRIVEQAVGLGIPNIFKKTDSALRGNIGSELAAVVDASKRSALHFIPAFPQMRRTTKNGVHFIDGVPVHESVFGKDPFEPVKKSVVADIIREQSSIDLINVFESSDAVEVKNPTILIYDAGTESKLSEITDGLYVENQPLLIAGCAGLASVLSKKLSFRNAGEKKPIICNRLLVVCGSVNPITLAQLEYAEKNGFSRVHLTTEQRMIDNYLETADGNSAVAAWMETLRNNDRCILDSQDPTGGLDDQEFIARNSMSINDVRMKISTNMGRVVKRLLQEGLDSAIMITGGDTLMGFINQTDIKEITPIEDVVSGTVLFTIEFEGRTVQILSKSGGFGNEKLLITLAERMFANRKEIAHAR
ncbi:four-carbon acid sugar kinase family protein [Youngiibacter fragilis]|uniref:Type III effector Hrp-dependent outer protein n=1 Tax=Youngiibacter fragilis 232.1 TaxID=994573 RepID=V7I7H9_9CLOT|nr:four-carbon acid sugar kinase family protein [Youngiibacter fragilis]ETA81838.1 type III effector Hrp-dependent outer protein [Youngiibacter fragilis 232.1]